MVRNPNLQVINMILHMYEKTPHLHIDYVPVATGYKQGWIAIDEEIIVENPMNRIYIKSKFRVVRKKSDGSKLYLNDEFDTLDTHLDNESTIEALCIRLMFQLGVRIGEGVALKFSDIEYGEIAIQRMEEKMLVFDGENFKSDEVQIVEHLKKSDRKNIKQQCTYGAHIIATKWNS